jgi:hypothetical protein
MTKTVTATVLLDTRTVSDTKTVVVTTTVPRGGKPDGKGPDLPPK